VVYRIDDEGRKPDPETLCRRRSVDTATKAATAHLQ